MGEAFAAAVSAGAAGAIAYTDRGATSDVKGNVQEVAQHTEAVFKDMGINKTDSSIKDSGKKQEINGKVSNPNITDVKDVSVTIKSVGENQANIDVIAKKGAIRWNKDYAKEILSNIIAKS